MNENDCNKRGKMHFYHRGYCHQCGAREDDWLRDDKVLELIGKAFKHLNEEAEVERRAKEQTGE